MQDIAVKQTTDPELDELTIAAMAAEPWLCMACDARMRRWEPDCPACGAHGRVMYRPPGFVPTPIKEPAPKAIDGLAVEPATATRVEYERVSTGFPSLDEALNGGYARTTLMLIGGERGSNKTTLVLGTFQRSRLHAAYATAEQSADQVVAIAQRTGATRRGLFIFDTKDLEDALARFDKLGARLVCLDSLNRFRAKGINADRGSPRTCAAIIERCQEWARERNAVVILVSHFTKDGDFAGRSDVQHDVDAMLKIRKYKGNVRVVTVEKTRLGPDEGRKARFIASQVDGSLREAPRV